MYLSVEQLRTIVDSLEALNSSAAPISVTQFRCEGHTVIVEREDTKQNKGPYVVKGITNGIVRDSSGANR